MAGEDLLDERRAGTRHADDENRARLLARQRGGKTLDRLQYGAGFAIAFGLFGTLLGIALARFLGAA